MHDQEPLNIISESENGYIGVCSCCKEYNFVYNNVLLSFREEELIRFGDWLMAHRYQLDTFLPLPSGRTRVYRSPMSNLFLAFYEFELDELHQLFSHAKIIIEARAVLESRDLPFRG